MASPKMLELEMQKQLLRKGNIRVIETLASGPNRATLRKYRKIANSLPRDQVNALLTVARQKGFIKDEDTEAT